MRGPVVEGTDHPESCFGCSPGTAGGLGFAWQLDGDRLEATHAFSERFEGPRGIAHGGAVAALLDEACSQVARAFLSPLIVTSRLEVRYLAPVPVGEELRVTATSVDVATRRVSCEATIQDESGLLLAHARVECVQARP